MANTEPCINPAHGVKNHIAGSARAYECYRSMPSTTVGIQIATPTLSQPEHSDKQWIMDRLKIVDPDDLIEVELPSSEMNAYVVRNDVRGRSVASAYIYCPDVDMEEAEDDEEAEGDGEDFIGGFHLMRDDPEIDPDASSDEDVIEYADIFTSSDSGWEPDKEIGSDDRAELTRAMIREYRSRPAPQS